MRRAKLQSATFSTGHTIIMTHAMFRSDGDVVAAFDDFPGGQVDGITLDDFLGQVLSGVLVFCFHCGKIAPSMLDTNDDSTCPWKEGHCLDLTETKFRDGEIKLPN